MKEVDDDGEEEVKKVKPEEMEEIMDEDEEN